MLVKKRKKQDPKLVSKQKHEIATVASKYGLTQKYVRELQATFGLSRNVIEAALKTRGYFPKKKVVRITDNGTSRSIIWRNNKTSKSKTLKQKK